MKPKSMQFPKHGKSKFPWYGKLWQNTNIPSKGMGFLHISRGAKIHTTPKTREKINSHSKGNYDGREGSLIL